MNLDRIMYCAFNDHGKLGIEAIVDPSMTRAELVERIRTGDLGFDKVIRVVAFNAAEGFSLDVTEEIFEDVEDEVQRLIDAEDFPVTARAMEKV